MIKLFLLVHLITPVKDRANTHCVQELQLQQSVAEDVTCMQQCVSVSVCVWGGINMEDSDGAEWPICGGDKGIRLSPVFMLSLGLILL